MHPVAFITLLRESLSGITKDSRKSLCSTVTVILEANSSLNIMYPFDLSSMCLSCFFNYMQNMLILVFLLALHLLTPFSMQIWKVSSSCENSSACRWKV